MAAEKRIALPQQVHDALMNYVSQQPWVEVNSIIAAVQKTATLVEVQLPDPAPENK